MKTIDVYECDCGDDIYEDDIRCVNCGVLVDPNKFKTEKLIEITDVGDTKAVDAGSIGNKNK